MRKRKLTLTRKLREYTQVRSKKFRLVHQTACNTIAFKFS